MNHDNVQWDAVEAAEQGLVAEKNRQFLINNMNTRANGLGVSDSYLTLFREHKEINTHASKKTQTLNSWSYSD